MNSTSAGPGSVALTGLAHHGVQGGVADDARLALAGAGLPWCRLGSGPEVPARADGLVELALAHVDVEEGGSLVLTDPTALPVALLADVRPVGGGVVAGTLHPVGAPGQATPAWAAPAAGGVVVVRRPPLRGELVDLPRPLRLVVPHGPSPDGIPAEVLLDVVSSVSADDSEVEVVPAPLHWRGPAAEPMLFAAYGELVGTAPLSLAAGDPAWVLVRDEVLDGRAPSALDPGGTEALAAWRPPVSRRGVVVFFTGLSGSGKSSLAEALVEHVRTRSRRTVTLLDGDVVRTMLSAGLGFDRAGRDLNIRRIGYVAAEIARHRGMAVCAPIAPFAETRAAVRAMVESGGGDFVLIHVATPLHECERRDRKGLYARARAGEIPDFTGISSPYEVPTDAQLVVDTTGRTLHESLDEVLSLLIEKGWLSE